MATNPLRDFVQALKRAECPFTVDKWLEDLTKDERQSLTAYIKQVADQRLQQLLGDYQKMTEMKPITPNMLIAAEPVVGETARESYFQEASMLGLAPGEWPLSLYFEREPGNRILLERKTTINPSNHQDGFVGYTYRSVGLSIKLDILND